MAKQTLLLFICLLYSTCYTTTWSPAPPLPFPMWGSVIGVNHNHTLMYLIGGDKSTSCNNNYTINTTYQFDGNLFKTIGTVPFQTRMNGGYINVLGMSTTVQDVTYFFNGFNDIIGFNTTSVKIDWFNISTPGGEFPMCLVSNDTHLFYLQYMYCKGVIISIFSYDIENKHWLQEYQEPQGWDDYFQGACVYYNHSIYVIGGIVPYTPDIWMYDIIQHRLSIVGTMTYSAVNLAAIMPNNNGIMYIIGGQGYNNFYKYVEVWNANTKKSISSSSLKTARAAPMVGFMKERIYVMGGLAGNFDESNYDVNVTKLTEMSDIIPTLSPTHSPTKPTHSPTKPTYSPTQSTYSPTNNPTISPTHSPTKPTNSPTNRPTKIPTKFVDVSFTEQQFIYYASGIIAFMFLCCIFWRCYQKKKPENNVIVNNNINVIGENIHHVSVDGAAFQNQSEGQLERDVEDTFNN